MEEPCDSSTDVSGVKQENGSFPAPPINEDATNQHWDVCPKYSAPSSPRSFVTSIQELNDELSHEIGKNIICTGNGLLIIFFLDLEVTKKLSSSSSPSPTFLPVLEGSKVDHDGDLPPIGSLCHLDKIDSGYGQEQQRRKEEGIVVPLLGVSSDFSIASTSASDGIGDISGGGGGSGGGSGSLSSLSLSCLQCRVCRREMPDDITATMCGHVFCNR